MQNSYETVVVHSDKHYNLENKKYNLLLTPSFYWIKKEEVGLPKLYQAKKIAASLFYGHIPEGEYKYLTEATDEVGSYLYYAYEDSKIMHLLEEIGITKNQIGKIYFLQQFSSQLGENAKVLSDSSVAILNDNIVSVAPRMFAPDALPLDSRSLNLPSKSISISSYDSNLGIDVKNAYILSVLFALLFALSLGQRSYYGSAI